MDTPDKVRENRLRRMVYRRGYRFHKSRLRDPMAVGYGRIRVETAEGREADGFESDGGLGLTLDDLEERLGDGEWAVYRLRAADRALLYVGSSNDPRARWSALSMNAWWAEVKYREVTWYPTEEEARKAEAEAVVSESPAHNIHLRSSDLTKSAIVRMTPEELAALDVARGQVGRSEWLRRILLGAEPRVSGKYSRATLPLPAASGCQQGSQSSALVYARLSDTELEVIETARGSMERSEWVRLALLAQTERQRPPAGSVDREAAAARQNPAALAGNCPHSKTRINKGLCGACGTNVGTRES